MHTCLPRAKVSGRKGYPNWKEVVCWCEKQIGYKLLIVEKIIFFLGIQWNWVITFSFAQVTILPFNWFIDEKPRKRASKHLGNFKAHFYCSQLRPHELSTLLQMGMLDSHHFLAENVSLQQIYCRGYFHNNVKNSIKASTMYFYNIRSLQSCLSIIRISLFIHNLLVDEILGEYKNLQA